MYSEKVEQKEKETELTIDFGKNKMGLSDELIIIGKKINELSKTNRIYLRDAFVDELDDVYQFKFVYFPLVEVHQILNTDDTRELLADYAHEAWCGWMKYMFSKAEINKGGTWVMPKWAVERWQRQMNTKYSELPEEEKKSDREEADKILNCYS